MHGHKVAKFVAQQQLLEGQAGLHSLQEASAGAASDRKCRGAARIWCLRKCANAQTVVFRNSLAA